MLAQMPVTRGIPLRIRVWTLIIISIGSMGGPSPFMPVVLLAASDANGVGMQAPIWSDTSDYGRLCLQSLGVMSGPVVLDGPLIPP